MGQSHLPTAISRKWKIKKLCDGTTIDKGYQPKTTQKKKSANSSHKKPGERIEPTNRPEKHQKLDKLMDRQFLSANVRTVRKGLNSKFSASLEKKLISFAKTSIKCPTSNCYSTKLYKSSRRKETTLFSTLDLQYAYSQITLIFETKNSAISASLEAMRLEDMNCKRDFTASRTGSRFSKGNRSHIY